MKLVLILYPFVVPPDVYAVDAVAVDDSTLTEVGQLDSPLIKRYSEEKLERQLIPELVPPVMPPLSKPKVQEFPEPYTDHPAVVSPPVTDQKIAITPPRIDSEMSVNAQQLPHQLD